MHFNFGVKSDPTNFVATNVINENIIPLSFSPIDPEYWTFDSNYEPKETRNYDPKSIAVEIKNVAFSYKNIFDAINGKSNLILNKCYITVPKGGIYALLGSSGCGKTTLLRCILGRIRPQMGSVRVFGETPGTELSTIPGPGVGYMPQELALYGEFTIEETLMYFGRLIRMNPKEISEKTDFLVSLFGLPNKKRIINDLSGGQQRRVSLASALFHKPPLAILDEPTVGVDPVLRQKIWNYLESLCYNDNLTVIITTHYIEEARNAGTVALMRSGRMLEEDKPDVLLERHNCNTLEAVFLKLCQYTDQKQNKYDDIKQKNHNNNNHYESDFNFVKINDQKIEKTKNDNKELKKLHKIQKRKFIDFGHLYLLIWKNWIKVRGNRALFIMYFLPSIQLSFFCASIGQMPRNISVSIYNEEFPLKYTESFLNELNKDMMTQIPHHSLDSAIESVRNGSSYFALSLHSNFSESLKIRTDEGGYSDDFTIRDSNVHVYADMSNAVIGISLYLATVRSYFAFVRDYLGFNGYNPNTVSQPIQITEVIYGVSEPSLREWIAPGAIIALIFFAPFALTIFVVCKERTEGLLERSLVVGARPKEILLAHFFIQAFVLIVESALMLITTYYIWGLPIEGSMFLAFLIVYSVGMSGVSLGLLIGSFCENETSGFLLGLGLYFPTWMLCGVFWPTESMFWLFKFGVSFLPLTLPIEALRYTVDRGWTLTEPSVLLGVTVSWIYIILLFIAGVFVFKKRV